MTKFLKRIKKSSLFEALSGALGGGGTISLTFGSVAMTAGAATPVGLIVGIGLICGGVVFKALSLRKKDDLKEISEYITYRSERIELRQYIIIILLSVLVLSQFQDTISGILSRLTRVVEIVSLTAVIIIPFVLIYVFDNGTAKEEEVLENAKSENEDLVEEIKKQVQPSFYIGSRKFVSSMKEGYFRSTFPRIRNRR